MQFTLGYSVRCDLRLPVVATTYSSQAQLAPVDSTLGERLVARHELQR